MDSQWALREALNIENQLFLGGHLLSREESDSEAWSEKSHSFLKISNDQDPEEDR